MNSKKLFSIILAGVTAMSLLTGCGASNGNQTPAEKPDSQTGAGENADTESSNAKSAETDNANEDSADAADTESTGKTLVVYYSATGHTKDVAETIAQVTGGDLFEIEPTEPYTSEDLDWTKDDSRVTKEHEDESLRDVELVTTEVENWDSYDTVYIGYPIWWGIAAWPVDGFVEANDFTGKTVIPFCTAASSGIGDSGKLLEELAGTGNWVDGERFRSRSTEHDIRSWIGGLGL